MVERRPALRGWLQPAELALRPRGRAHDRCDRPRGCARKAAPAAGPRRAAAVPAGGGDRSRVLPRLGAAAPGVGLVRSARCAASLHRLIRGRLVHRQRLSLDLGRGQPPATERSVISAGAWRLGRPSGAPAGRRPSGRRPARSDARLHRWLLLAAALERRGPRTPPRPGGPAARRQPRARISHTGYRWSFELQDAFGLLLATDVGGEALSHEHGAPVRLVAPGRRGFEWVKWVVCVELHDSPDPGALASTVWSSFTPEGRGAA